MPLRPAAGWLAALGIAPIARAARRRRRLIVCRPYPAGQQIADSPGHRRDGEQPDDQKAALVSHPVEEAPDVVDREQALNRPHLHCRIGIEHEFADLVGKGPEDRRGEGIGQEGHRRCQRHIGAHRHRKDRGEYGLREGHDDAHSNAQRHTARHRAAGEAPQFGAQRALGDIAVAFQLRASACAVANQADKRKSGTCVMNVPA